MEGLPIGLDIFRHHAQPWLFSGPATLHGLFPQFFVAARAIDLLQGSGRILGVGVALVGIVHNVAMACHALHVGMNALSVLVAGNAAQQARLVFRTGHFQLAFLAIMAA